MEINQIPVYEAKTSSSAWYREVGFIALLCLITAILPKLKSLITACRNCASPREPQVTIPESLLRYHKNGIYEEVITTPALRRTTSNIE